jgi:glycosyltransferase involved in cell wall biosynthesis
MTGIFFKDVVLELHLLPKKIKPFHLYVWKRAKKLIVLTSFIKKRMIDVGISPDKIIVASDGVNLSMFDILVSKEEARIKTHLPQDKKILGYVGMLRTLGMEKGVDVAIKALAEIKDKNAIFVLVGGSTADIDFYKNLAMNMGISERIIFVGRVEHSQIPIYLKAFDVLLAPFPENEHYSFYMSPMKIFEYMASKRPIISTALPTLREIIGDSALLVKPGKVDSLRDGINKVLDNSELSENLSKKAYDRVLEYTWQNRAKNILKFIKL